jgi:beta-lactamase class A
MLFGGFTLFGIELVRFSQLQSRIPFGVTVAGVEVGGLLPGEAVAKWEQAYAQPIVLYYDDAPILLDPASVGFRPNNQVMLAAASAANSTGGAFWSQFLNHLLQQDAFTSLEVPLTAEYQQSLLQNVLVDVANRYDRAAGDVGYDLESLTISSGNAGFALNINDALTQIEQVLYSPDQRQVRLPIGGTTILSADMETLRDLIIAYLDSEAFIYDGQTTVASVYIVDLQTGEEININGDVAFSAASTQKVAILVEYFRNLVFAPSQEEAWLMANSLLCSNNSSSNLLMQIIGEGNLFAGLGKINSTMQYLGVRNTFITAPFDLGIAGQQLGSIAPPATAPNPNFDTGADPYNRTTAEDMGTLFTLVYDCAYYGSGLEAAFPEAYTQTECRQMLELMSGNNLLRLLQAGLPPETRISHKNGWIFDMVGDAGVVYSPNGRHYVIAVYLWEEAEFQDYDRLWSLLEGISRASWNFFNPEQSLTAQREDIPLTAQECEGNYLPPSMEQVNLDDIDSWKAP